MTAAPQLSAPSRRLSHSFLSFTLQRVGSPSSSNRSGDLVAEEMGIHETFPFKLVCLKWNCNHIQEMWFSSVLEDHGCLCLFLCGKCFVKESNSSCCSTRTLPAAEGPRVRPFQAPTPRFTSIFFILTENSIWISFTLWILQRDLVGWRLSFHAF